MPLTPKQLATADARLTRLRALVRGLPDVDVDAAGHGHLAFRVRGKAFAYRAFDHHGYGKVAVWVKATRDVQARLVRDEQARLARASAEPPPGGDPASATWE